MRIKILHETKTVMEFMLYDEEHTFANLLKDVLYQLNDVKAASYRMTHPLKREIRFYIETKGISPREALIKAIKKIKSFSTKLINQI